MERIDIYPTHTYQGYKLRPGRAYPFGATPVPGGVNFSIFSRHANYCVLVLFEKGKSSPMIEIPFRGMFQKAEIDEPVWGEFRIGNVFCMTVFDLDYESVEYGFRMDGPYPKVERGQPGQHRFDPSKILMDPYAKAIGGREVWGQTPDWNNGYHHRARLVYDDFDWEGDRPLEIPLEDLIIYEMHVRSFTRHPSSGVKRPGTFAAIREKIPYLKELGVNCIELMPIYEFDEFENSRVHPDTGELLMNYWGYSTVGFFAPKAGYAATGKSKDGTQVADELKTLVKELHKNGIEIMLDVVFNHTAEGNEYGPAISFRGIDNVTYYMLTPEGYYYNFSGTGNTLNCNNPIVRNMVLECLRYWAAEYHIDGFRFDLAAILGRDPWGAPLPNPPLLEALAFDPILGKCKLIAEAWDAGGLYQVGSFPAYGRWAEWNGKYRDDVRKFLKGDMGLVGAMSQRLQGSPDLYAWGGRGPTASINFITCHDGFTLHDLVAYNGKHNEANGENNNDGGNDNHSWNCGWEGPSTDPAVNELRSRQMKNAIAMLLVSQGVPMILSGDEMGHTQHGNNNAYCHDTELSWLDWTRLEANADLFRFFKNCIAFRKAHPVLRSKTHFSNQDYVGSGYADITWHGTHAWNADWSGTNRSLAFMLCGQHAKGGTVVDNYIYVAMNMYWETLPYTLPGLPAGMKWHVFVNTGASSPEDSWQPGSEPSLEDQTRFLVGGRSVVILVGK
ncbi:MAG TPA: glycogen debranching protein GlgX [Anaerolineae bacterium]|nr:glycogen debranching protein GlgX [Anaerolineae bacterium]